MFWPLESFFQCSLRLDAINTILLLINFSSAVFPKTLVEMTYPMYSVCLNDMSLYVCLHHIFNVLSGLCHL